MSTKIMNRGRKIKKEWGVENGSTKGDGAKEERG